VDVRKTPGSCALLTLSTSVSGSRFQLRSNPASVPRRASTSGAGAAGEIREHSSPATPHRPWPQLAADRERRRRGRADPDPVGGKDLIAPTTMAGAVSALFLLDMKGRVLVWRDYRGDVSALQAERFFTKLLDKEVSGQSVLAPRLLSTPEICAALVLSSRAMGRAIRKCTRLWSTTTLASLTCSSSTTMSSSSPPLARTVTRPASSSSSTV
jgi:hypothetical protein